MTIGDGRDDGRDVGELAEALAHVYWIGGGTDAGKTTIAERLAAAWGAQVYHFDRHEMAHFARATPDRTPALWAAHPDRMTAEERWLGSLPEEMATTTVACWTERFWMAIDDLLGLPATTPIVAEGTGFFPACVAPLLTQRNRAIWLVPTETFKRTSVAQRGKLRGLPVSDPARAVESLIQRDLLMNAHIRQSAADLDLPVIEVDGSRDLGAMTELVGGRLR